jgi:hypothetical protein
MLSPLDMLIATKPAVEKEEEQNNGNNNFSYLPFHVCLFFNLI